MLLCQLVTSCYFTESLQKDVNLETMLAVLQTTCAQTEEESEVRLLIILGKVRLTIVMD